MGTVTYGINTLTFYAPINFNIGEGTFAMMRSCDFFRNDAFEGTEMDLHSISEYDRDETNGDYVVTVEYVKIPV
jgi:hypothetical protein